MNYEARDFLIRCAIASPSADNSQPFCFGLQKDGFDVRYDAERVVAKTFGPGDPATLISLGALLENVGQGAAAIGLDPRIDLWPEGRDAKQFYARVSFLENPKETQNFSDLCPSLFDRHTNRGRYAASRRISVQLLDGIEPNYRNDARLIWFADERVKGAAKLVRRASEVRFQTREVHEWLMQSLRFDDAEASQGDGLDLATLSLPPGGKLLLKFIHSWGRMRILNRLGFYRLMAAIDAQPLAKAPLALGVVSPSSPDSLIDAGGLMEQVWIELNERGLAMHPYFVVADQLHRLQSGKVDRNQIATVAGIAEDSRRVLGLGTEEQVQMIFRIGYPEIEPVRSRRLPLEMLINKREESAS